MSNSIKKVGGALTGGVSSLINGLDVSTDTSADEALLNYFNSLNTENVDKSYENMAKNAYDLSTSLVNRPDYVYSVDGSDEARQRAEQATYQAYLDKLLPQHKTQMADLETRLANQGLAVGSEAYQRAVSDLSQSQNDALNQAAYNSVISGQDAFTQSLQNAINAGNFTNVSRQLPVNEIFALLQNSMSGNDKALNTYSTQKGIITQQAQDEQQSFNNLMSLLGVATKGLG